MQQCLKLPPFQFVYIFYAFIFYIVSHSQDLVSTFFNRHTWITVYSIRTFCLLQFHMATPHENLSIVFWSIHPYWWKAQKRDTGQMAGNFRRAALQCWLLSFLKGKTYWPGNVAIVPQNHETYCTPEHYGMDSWTQNEIFSGGVFIQKSL